jgi:hypothetical protein
VPFSDTKGCRNKYPRSLPTVAPHECPMIVFKSFRHLSEHSCRVANEKERTPGPRSHARWSTGKHFVATILSCMRSCGNEVRSDPLRGLPACPLAPLLGPCHLFSLSSPQCLPLMHHVGRSGEAILPVCLPSSQPFAFPAPSFEARRPVLFSLPLLSIHLSTSTSTSRLLCRLVFDGYDSSKPPTCLLNLGSTSRDDQMDRGHCAMMVVWHWQYRQGSTSPRLVCLSARWYPIC